MIGDNLPTRSSFYIGHSSQGFQSSGSAKGLMSQQSPLTSQTKVLNKTGAFRKHAACWKKGSAWEGLSIKDVTT